MALTSKWQRVSGKAFVGAHDHPLFTNRNLWSAGDSWGELSYVNGYWIILDRIRVYPLPYGANTYRTTSLGRIATSPEGPWQIMTGWPWMENNINVSMGFQVTSQSPSPVQFDGTYYYVLMHESIQPGGGSAEYFNYYVYYTTNPLGTWTKYLIHSWVLPQAPSYYPADAHYFNFIKRIDNYWVVGGTNYGGVYRTSPNNGSGYIHKAVLGYHTGSSPANPFTFTLDPAITGYDTTTLTSNNNSHGFSIENIFKMGGNYISLAGAQATSVRSGSRISTTGPLGPWSMDGNWANYYVHRYPRLHSNGVLTTQGWAGNVYPFIYKTSYNGAWQTSTAHPTAPKYDDYWSVLDYVNGVWVVGGKEGWYDQMLQYSDVPFIKASTSLTGSWTDQDAGFYFPDGWDVTLSSICGHGNALVASSDNQSELRYATVE